jgi:hypothetical protein
MPISHESAPQIKGPLPRAKQGPNIFKDDDETTQRRRKSDAIS